MLLKAQMLLLVPRLALRVLLMMSSVLSAATAFVVVDFSHLGGPFKLEHSNHLLLCIVNVVNFMLDVLRRDSHFLLLLSCLVLSRIILIFFA